MNCSSAADVFATPHWHFDEACGPRHMCRAMLQCQLLGPLVCSVHTVLSLYSPAIGFKGQCCFPMQDQCINLMDRPGVVVA